jgi:DNA-binding MarR family transcriptional regulator
MTVQWLTADEQRTWRAYMRAGTLLTARLNRQLQEESGLSLPEYEVLVQLSEAPDGTLRPFQLGMALDWEQSRLSHLVSRMTRRGFITRQGCPGDRRGTLIVLTRWGREAIESAAPGHVAAVRRLVFDQMDGAQAAAFGQAFEAILAALEDDARQLPRSRSRNAPLRTLARDRAPHPHTRSCATSSASSGSARSSNSMPSSSSRRSAASVSPSASAAAARANASLAWSVRPAASSASAYA